MKTLINVVVIVAVIICLTLLGQFMQTMPAGAGHPGVAAEPINFGAWIAIGILGGAIWMTLKDHKW